MLDNLVSNAILYNKDNGMITLSCEKEGKLQVISVEDTGIGLTKDQTERVFDDFYKADISRHDHNVHGLGLSIVRRIISLYGGTVTAKSPGLGLGSNFQIYLAGEDVRSDATLSEYGG
nr:ATP-binding protein [Methanospirillum sp.]